MRKSSLILRGSHCKEGQTLFPTRTAGLNICFMLLDGTSKLAESTGMVIQRLGEHGIVNIVPLPVGLLLPCREVRKHGSARETTSRGDHKKQEEAASASFQSPISFELFEPIAAGAYQNDVKGTLNGWPANRGASPDSVATFTLTVAGHAGRGTV